MIYLIYCSLYFLCIFSVSACQTKSTVAEATSATPVASEEEGFELWIVGAVLGSVVASVALVRLVFICRKYVCSSNSLY